MVSIPERVLNELERRHVSYETLPHTRDYTAQRTAQHTETSGRNFAKVVVLVVDDRYIMAVLPAHHRVSMSRLREELGSNKIWLAAENELKMLFPDCEIGAEPPFGNLYNIPVYVSDELSNCEELVFNAGTHDQAIKMKYADFASMVKPEIVRLSKMSGEQQFDKTLH